MDPRDSTLSRDQEHQNPDSGDLMGSAKLLAEAARSTFNHETDKVDQAKVAMAAPDILDAASHYGKLEQTSYGKYVDKAEDYLRQYGSAKPSADASQTEAPAAVAAAAEPHSSETQSGDEEHLGSGGQGEDPKKAEGFLNSGGEEEQSGSGGGLGGYVKMAQGFLK